MFGADYALKTRPLLLDVIQFVVGPLDLHEHFYKLNELLHFFLADLRISVANADEGVESRLN